VLSFNVPATGFFPILDKGLRKADFGSESDSTEVLQIISREVRDWLRIRRWAENRQCRFQSLIMQVRFRSADWRWLYSALGEMTMAAGSANLIDNGLQ
jgi:hypothetical protein